jgi:hypothetical protein
MTATARAFDPYAVLGLPRYSATDAQVKARQRVLLRVIHPDANPDVDAEERSALDREAAAINGAVDALLRHRADTDLTLRQAEEATVAPPPEPQPEPAAATAPPVAARWAYDEPISTPFPAPAASASVAPDSHSGLAWFRYTSRGQWTAFVLFTLAFGSLGLGGVVGFAVVQLALAGHSRRTTPAYRIAALFWHLVSAGGDVAVAGMRRGWPVVERLMGRLLGSLWGGFSVRLGRSRP